jgi:hypothetical protein
VRGFQRSARGGQGTARRWVGRYRGWPMEMPETLAFSRFSEGSKKWLGVWDDFRNWLIRAA